MMDGQFNELDGHLNELRHALQQARDDLAAASQVLTRLAERCRRAADDSRLSEEEHGDDLGTRLRRLETLLRQHLRALRRQDGSGSA
jgi:chromosome segregation ATPase